MFASSDLSLQSPELVPSSFDGLYLYRFEQSPISTLGTLFYNHQWLCFTLEPPWKDNLRGISCIPAKTYKCEYRQSPRFGLSLKVLNVFPRAHILFHSGNTTKDTQGCILPGLDINLETHTITQSRAAKTILYNKVPKTSPTTLTITEKTPISDSWTFAPKV